ncbi:MAG: M23 family metallopeptidase, partial [Muribaculaceae bacterium]|nr:M23 family metallopeptidase [Muribaculaceae bacterium]
RAVFGGEVVSVFKVKGTGFYAILVRHGKYISVYSKLGSYSVRNGQQVKAGQNLGTVFTDPELNSTVLHFELRRESATLNPLEWIK